MTDKLELKSSHEVVYTVNVEDVESIFYCKPTDPDILTVLMKDGKRLYCDEVCPVDSMQEEPGSEELETFAKKESEAFAKREYEIGYIDRNALGKGYYWGCINGANWQKQKDFVPVSEDLDEAAEKCISGLIPETELNSATPFALEYVVELLHNAFKAGVNWQKENVKTHSFEYDVFFCKHQGQLFNQGYTFCYAGHDPSKCNECEFREPEHIVTKFTTTSYETKPEKFVRKERRTEQ